MTTSHTPDTPHALGAVAALQDMAQRAIPGGLGHAIKAQTLFNRHATHWLSNGWVAMHLAPRLMDPSFWQESIEMQQATAKRLQQQHDNWVKGCAELMQDYGRIQEANTVTKLVEKQYNFMAQWNQLLGNQATSLMGLLENVEVAYGYWISEKAST